MSTVWCFTAISIINLIYHGIHLSSSLKLLRTFFSPSHVFHMVLYKFSFQSDTLSILVHNSTRESHHLSPILVQFYPPRTVFPADFTPSDSFLSILPPSDSFFHPFYPPRTVYLDNFTLFRHFTPSDSFSWDPPRSKRTFPPPSCFFSRRLKKTCTTTNNLMNVSLLKELNYGNSSVFYIVYCIVIKW